jgi:hypothetical protein
MPLHSSNIDVILRIAEPQHLEVRWVPIGQVGSVMLTASGSSSLRNSLARMTDCIVFSARMTASCFRDHPLVGEDDCNVFSRGQRPSRCQPGASRLSRHEAAQRLQSLVMNKTKRSKLYYCMCSVSGGACQRHSTLVYT